MTTIKLGNIGYSIGIIRENADTIDVRFKIVTTGDYTDMSGTPVKITKELLQNIAKKYKEDVYKVWEEDHSNTSDIAKSIEEFENRNAPIMKDHNLSMVDNTTGLLVGLLEVMPIKNGRFGLFGTARIIGAENKYKVRMKLYRNISIQFHPETYELAEISWVAKGADWTAVSMLGEYKADANNITNLYGNNIISNRFLTLQHVCDTIRLTDELILKLDNEIKVDKYLIALCKHRKLSKYEANLLRTKIVDQPNALGIIKIVDELMDPRLPKLKFIDGKRPDGNKILAHLKFNQHEGNTMSDNALTISNDPVTNYFLQQEAQEAGTVAMGVSTDEEVPLGKKELAKHRKYLSDKMAEHYEKDEKELAKKFREKLAKFEADCEMGKLGALSEYDIEEEGGKSEEIKKKEKELAKLKDDLAIALAEKERLAADIIRLQKEQIQPSLPTPEEQLNVLMQAYNSIVHPKSIGAA